MIRNKIKLNLTAYLLYKEPQHISAEKEHVCKATTKQITSWFILYRNKKEHRQGIEAFLGFQAHQFVDMIWIWKRQT